MAQHCVAMAQSRSIMLGKGVVPLFTEKFAAICEVTRWHCRTMFGVARALCSDELQSYGIAKMLLRRHGKVGQGKGIVLGCTSLRSHAKALLVRAQVSCGIAKFHNAKSSIAMEWLCEVTRRYGKVTNGIVLLRQ